ncbi:MAG: SIS domain-containing protein, partial [bacterium]
KKKVLDQHVTTINRITQLLIQALKEGKKVILFGNGGSAADSQHIAAEFVNRFRQDRNALPALALTTDTSILTSIANDYDFEHVFSRQIEAIGQKGDVAIGISTSGNSTNVLRGIRTSREKGLTTVGFTGQNGGLLKDVVDVCFQAPSQSTPRIQEVHITVAHAICDIVESEVCHTNAWS